MVPLFGGLPGGPELIIVFIVFLFMLAIPVGVGAGLFLLGRWSANRGEDDEVDRLQRRVGELEEQLATARDGDGARDGDADSDGGNTPPDAADRERQGS